MQNNLLVQNLQVSVGKKKNQTVLIDSFSYEFAPGKVYFIVGPSGVGKTTLVAHFNGLKKSKQGDIFVKDKHISSKDKKIKNVNDIRKEIQLVFQFPEHQLFKSTILKDASYGPINFGVDKTKAQELAKKYLSLLNIDPSLYEESPFVLSNGQKRKVAIAGIMAIEPNIYIFDEPTVGLDPASQKRTINLINKLKELGKTVIIVSHNADNALALADEVLVIYDKKLMAYGKPYDIFSDSRLMNLTSTKTPYIIELINLLNISDLYKYQPRTIDELATIINKLMKGGN